MSIVTQLLSHPSHSTHQPQVLRLLKESAFTTKFRSLIAFILSSHLFGNELKLQVQAWQEMFFTYYEPHLTTEEEKENAATEIVLFLSDYFYSLLTHSSTELQNEILLLEEKAKELLMDLLPEGTNIDNFIEQTEQFSIEEQVVNQELQSCIQKQFEKLLTKENAISQEMESHFNSLRQRLISINLNRQTKFHAFESKLNQLAAKIEQIMQGITLHSHQTEQTAEMLAKQQQNLKRLLGELHELLDTL